MAELASPPAVAAEAAELIADALADYVATTRLGRATASGAPQHIATWLVARGHRIVSTRHEELGLPALEVLAPVIGAAGDEALDAWVTVLGRLATGEQAIERLGLFEDEPVTWLHRTSREATGG